MGVKFLELLNLNEKLKEVLSIFQVKSRKEKTDTYYQIYYESSRDLTSEEVLELVRKTTKIDQVKVLAIDIFIMQPNQKTKGYEIYSHLRFILDSLFNINHSHYFVEINKQEAIIKTAKSDVRDNLEFHNKVYKNILSNLGIWSGKINIELDRKALDYSFFNERKTSKMNRQIEKERTNPPPLNGYKLVNPLTIREDIEKAYFEGEVFHSEIRRTRNGQFIANIKIAKDHKALALIKFVREEGALPKIKKGMYIRAHGQVKYSSYSKEYQLNVNNFQILDRELDSNEFSEDVTGKRIELHAHTKMSAMDGIATPEGYATRAKEMGIEALAIVDHNSVQSFPDASYVSEDFKFIYGVELDVVNDIDNTIVYNEKDIELTEAEMVYWDLETTGLSPLNNEIIEFGGVKVRGGEVVERLQLFVNPKVKITEEITKLTHITQEDVIGAPSIKEVLPQIISFFGDAVLVAHNSEFDTTFLNSHLRRNDFPEIKNTMIDSMKISWFLNPDSRMHRLGNLARIEGVSYSGDVAHRADYDAEVLFGVFENMKMRLLEKDIRNVLDLNKLIPKLINYIFTDHITVLAKNEDGLKELYKIISDINTTYFNKRKKSPQILLSDLLSRRKNLLIGSACDKGIAFKAASQDLKDIDRIFKYFDYIEIFPTNVYGGQIAKGFFTREGIQHTIRKMYQVAEDNNIITVATGNAHYVMPEDKIARDVYISAKGLGGKLHPLFDRKNPKYVKPNQHLRSTSEMIGSMERIFKSKDVAEKVVIENTNLINEMIDVIKPLKKDLYTPKIKGARNEFLRLIRENTIKNYGKNPPDWIRERIEREVESITKHGYDIVYFLSSLAVRKSLKDGYLVGSRGSVGSSIVATLTEITEVNPLEAHYLCSTCKYVEKIGGGESGYDLPNKGCPVCKGLMKGEGHDIPFETFLGFEGDKVPDIDLNFSGDYQSQIHQFIKNELREKNVFKAGTISTVATKTAYGYVKGYYESMEKEFPSNTTIEYLASIVEGTKRTTGQHPGGLIVIPDNLDVEDFSPINYPGNDSDALWKTTHFDFHSIHDNVLKLDLLGHIDPSAIRMLEDITGVNSTKEIRMNDEKVLSLFIDNNALQIKEKLIDEDLGIIGIPEFGTGFVRELVRDAKPKTFADLVRVSGLSHGTDVWVGNAKEIIDNGIGELKDVISVRDDIMTYLIRHEVTPIVAFQFMEAVRKGLLSSHPKRVEWENELREKDVPEWYIESCNKIKYMFPKAHATAYVMMAFRIAWFKVNHPLAYYSTFFTKRDTEWDLDVLYKQPKEIIKYRDSIKKLGWESTDKEKNTSSTLLIVLEMMQRGFSIESISIKKSHATDWIVNEKNNSLIPPFSIMEGLGGSAARKITDAREQKEFENLDDFKARSGVSKTLQEKMLELGILGKLKTFEDTAFDIFNMFK